MSTPEFVQWFREAAPYIHAFRGRTFVIAFGGEVISQGKFAGLSYDLNLLVSMGVRIVLVHGARPQIDALLAVQGLTPRFHGSIRITDPDTLEVVKQAVGVTRADIEAGLSMALPNSPMAGANLRVAAGNYLVARPLGVRDGVDMLYTGQIRKIDTPGAACPAGRRRTGDAVHAGLFSQWRDFQPHPGRRWPAPPRLR